jgi:hypothetical protein
MLPSPTQSGEMMAASDSRHSSTDEPDSTGWKLKWLDAFVVLVALIGWLGVISWVLLTF